jgi:hypothetical protein
MAIQSEPKYAAIDAAALGANTLIAAVAGRKIRVLALTLVGAGAVEAKFQSGAAGTDLTGAMALAASTVVSASYNPAGHFETAAGVLLNLNLSAATGVRGWLTYVLVE